MEKIGKYTIAEKIGVGGFGEVYKGYDPFIKREVAVKTCSSNDPEIRTRFFQEAEIAGNLHHRNVTTIYDFGIQNELPYLIQEYLSGEDLDRKIKRRDFLPYPEKLYYLLQIARGLAYAHSRGVIHRDIKPANIRVLEDGTTKIMDFGIAKLAQRESTLTQTGMTLGTAAYLAPEQIQGEEIDHRTDVFSYGVLAYELLTYERPFQGKQISAVLYEILHSKPRAVQEHWPGAPADIVRFIERCLEKDPTLRFRDGNELLRELENVQKAGRSQREKIETGATVQMSNSDAQAMADAARMPTPSSGIPTQGFPTGPGGFERTPTPSAAVDLMERTPTHSSAVQMLERTPTSSSRPAAPFTDLPSLQDPNAAPTLDDIGFGGGSREEQPSTNYSMPEKAPSALARLAPLIILALLAAGAGWWFGAREPQDPTGANGGTNPSIEPSQTEDVQPTTTVDVQPPPQSGGEAKSPAEEVEPGALVLVAPSWTEAMTVQVGRRTYDLNRNRQLNLPPNTYTCRFRIEIDGYSAEGTTRAKVESGQTRTVEAPIEQPGAVTVRPLPGRPQGKIWLGETLLGNSPIRRRFLAPGSYQITIRPNGEGSEIQQAFQIQGGQETILSFDLDRGRVSPVDKALSP